MDFHVRYDTRVLKSQPRSHGKNKMLKGRVVKFKQIEFYENNIRKFNRLCRMTYSRHFEC